MDLHAPHRHHRRSTRLLGYDYSAAASYFVTLCTEGRDPLFGRVVRGAMELNELGAIVEVVWERTPEVRPTLGMDVVVVMPNHLHGIVTFREADDGGPSDARSADRAHNCAPLHRRPRSLGSFISGFKATPTRRINDLRGTPQIPVWQRNYYDHVIRNDADYARIHNYILTNPLRWWLDRENVDRLGDDEFDGWLDSFHFSPPSPRPPL